jgi:hypothetical protein
MNELNDHAQGYFKGRKDGFNEGKAVGSETAWLDLLKKFTPKQRQHLAMLLAHDWQVSEITIMSPEGHTDTVKV